MVVSSLEYWVSGIWSQSPSHLAFEVALLVFIVILLLRKPKVIKDPKDELTVEEEDAIIAAWKPAPPVPNDLPADADLSILNTHVVSSGPSDTIVVDDVKALNFATPNYFGLNMNPEITEAAQKAIDHYAVGACGPRQFYGTMDAHLDLEKAIAQWTSCEDSVNYCYPFATTTSLIQAFIRNTDILFVDEGSWFAVQLGAELTRSKVVLYKHNDMGDLRNKVIENRKTFARWSKVNRWVATEGLFANDGTIVDLPALIALREELCLRILIDETHSFGSLGKTGRGVCELYNIDRSKIEVCIGSLGTCFASLGGFTIGTKEVCDHQRLASHAYIFSASPPPFNVVAASKAVEIVEKDGSSRINTLQKNIATARNALRGLPNFEVVSDERSPLIHLRYTKEISLVEENNLLTKIVDNALLDKQNPTAVVKSKYVRTRDRKAPRPTIKFFVSPAHSESQIINAGKAIKNAIEKALSH